MHSGTRGIMGCSTGGVLGVLEVTPHLYPLFSTSTVVSNSVVCCDHSRGTHSVKGVNTRTVAPTCCACPCLLGVHQGVHVEEESISSLTVLSTPLHVGTLYRSADTADVLQDTLHHTVHSGITMVTHGVDVG